MQRELPEIFLPGPSFPLFCGPALHFRKDSRILWDGFSLACLFEAMPLPLLQHSGNNANELTSPHLYPQLSLTFSQYLSTCCFLAHRKGKMRLLQQAGCRMTKFPLGEMSFNGSCSPTDVSPLENTATWQLFLSHLVVFETVGTLP